MPAGVNYSFASRPTATAIRYRVTVVFASVDDDEDKGNKNWGSIISDSSWGYGASRCATSGQE